MKLSDLGEFGFIRRIAEGCVVEPDRVVKAIGDDCAVAPGEGGMLRLLTTDLLVERVHFLRGSMSPQQLGAKAMAVNLSDIAAMGGRPLDAYVSIAIPQDTSVDYLDGVYGGLKAMAGRFSVNVLGGDTTGSKQDLVINVAVTGEVNEAEILYRGGARPGDAVFLTGFVGDSGAGLDALLHDRALEGDAAMALVRRHLEPKPHVLEGRVIAGSGLATAMIDVSDGVAADLGHVCEESVTGCRIEANLLPISPELTAYAKAHGLDPVNFALSGGEDYVLLVTGDPRLAGAMDKEGMALIRIGEIVEGGARTLIRPDGGEAPLDPGGWDHFREER